MLRKRALRCSVAALLLIAAACAPSPYRKAAAPFAAATERASLTLPATLQTAHQLCHRRDELDRLQRLLEGRDASGREERASYCDELAAAGELHRISLVLLQEYGRGLTGLAAGTRYDTRDFTSIRTTESAASKLAQLLVGGWADSNIEQAVLQADEPVQELLGGLATYGNALTQAIREHRAALREVGDLVISRQARATELPDLDRAFSIAERFASLESEAAGWERSVERFDTTIAALLDAQQALAAAAQQPEDATRIAQLAGRAAAVQVQLRLLSTDEAVADAW